MKQPSAPNPYQQAGAQQNADMFSSQASSVMNNPNIYTPWGSQTYSIAGYDQIQGADGQMRYVPRYNQTQTLSPDQMQLYGLQTQAGYNLGQTAVEQSAKLRGLMGQGINTGSLTPWQQGPQAGKLATGFADVGGPQRQIAGGGPIQSSIQGGGPIQKAVAGGGDIQKSVGAQDFRQDQGRTDREGIEQAMMALYNRQAGQRNAAEGAQLAARGATGAPIGEAANYRQGEEATNAGLQSYLASGQESRQAQDAYNQAAQQKLSQDVTRGTFANQAVGQQFQQNLGQGEFANRAQAQQLAENSTLGQFANAAQLQQFNQNAAQGTFANAATDMAYQHAMNRAGFGNQALTQQFTMGGQEADRANALRGGQLQELMALRNQPLNEILALMGGAGITTPSFSPYQGQGMSSANVGGYMGQNYANAANAASMFNQGLFNFMGNIAGGATRMFGGGMGGTP